MKKKKRFSPFSLFFFFCLLFHFLCRPHFCNLFHQVLAIKFWKFFFHDCHLFLDKDVVCCRCTLLFFFTLNILFHLFGFVVGDLTIYRRKDFCHISARILQIGVNKGDELGNNLLSLGSSGHSN